MNSNQASWEKGDFTEIAGFMRQSGEAVDNKQVSWQEGHSGGPMPPNGLGASKLERRKNNQKRKNSMLKAIWTAAVATAMALMTTLGLVGFYPSRALAQAGHSHAVSTQTVETTPDQQSKASALLAIVRKATERFQDVSVAEAAGYTLQFGCVSGDTDGAMGLHFVNSYLLSSGIIDATRPPIVIYEPLPNGRLRLIGADYLVLANSWNSTHSSPPQLMGQLFHFFDAPNRFGLPAFYTLHVWAWKENPSGAFVNWHPNVSCQSFSGQTP
jgi:hypothetical protein